MITKEDTTPEAADKLAYNIAPILSLAAVLMIWAVVPFTETWIGTDLNVGVLYAAAVGSFGVLAILMAGWSSNNKYALLGAFRGVAQLISYEVPLFLSLLIPVLLARTMSVNGIVKAQDGMWFFVFAPLAFIIFFISNLAEIGRTPFDLLEAESEIVAGYHVEYSGMKFGLFQGAEFAHSFTSAALLSILFFGGWQGPGVQEFPLLGLLYFFIKTFAFYFVIMWIRLTLPRIRIDHMMAMNWKFMVPVSLALLMATPILDFFVKDMGYIRIGSHLALNLVILTAALGFAGRAMRADRPERVRFPERPVAVPPKEEEAAV
jgi:NADH-quinone oxidoreductase subunit H